MKKTKKRTHKLPSKMLIIIITVVIAISCIFVFAAKASSGFGSKIFNSYSDTYDKSTSLYTMIREGYNYGDKGPMSIVKGNLCIDNDEKKSYDVYLVMLSGTEVFAGESNDVEADIKAAFGTSNDYLTNAIENIEKNIEKGSNIFLAGHSLGGMVAQQVSANEKIKKDYNVLYTITYGAPPVKKNEQEGEINRLGDTKDIVPFLSIYGIMSIITEKNDVQKEDGGYDDQIKAHRDSYARDDVWGKYDVVGMKDKKSSFSFNKDEIKFYKCPKLDNDSNSNKKKNDQK